MAQIDSRIALGVQPMQVENPMNALARMMQVKALQQQSEVNALTMQEKQRAIQQENALANALRTPGFSWENETHRNSAFSAAPTKAQELYKGHLDVENKRGEGRKRDFEIAKDRYAVYQKTAGALFSDPQVSKPKVLQAVSGLVTSGVLDQAIGEKLAASLPDDPVQLREALRQAVSSQLTPAEMLTAFAPKPTQVDNGQQLSFRDTNPNSPTYGQVTAGGVVQKVATPDAVLSSDTSTANNKRSVGASYANAAATREIANATRDAASIKDRRDTEMKLGDDYRAQSKPFKEVADAHKIIKASLKNATTSAAATLAGATKFMKLLDPGSVVRESELGMALAASGVLDRAAWYFNTLKNGKTLNPKQAADFESIADQIYKAAQDGQKQVDANYARQAKQYGLREDMIVQDLGQNTPVPVDIGSLPPAGAPAGKPRVVDFGSLK